MERVIIFDTTLRDGEQSPGATMNLPEKLEVARALAALGVNIIEAGFPVASPGDFEAVQIIARQVEGPTIAALARCSKADIESAAQAVADAPKKRLHLFLATSPIHREYKLNMTPPQVVARAVEAVSMARALSDDVEFSAEDAARTEHDFLAEVFERVIEAGATTLNVPDTVGYTVPECYADIIKYLRAHVRGIEKAILSVHCHNDLGLAVANSLAALAAGARQVECTINGLGERAGNCALEEVVMALRTRADYYKLTTDIKTPRLYLTSRLVSNVTGLQVPRNKAVVGQNAFAHEAGIHQHGMLKHHSTYEIMRPEDVGVPKNNLVLGKHSGRHAFRLRVEELGYALDDMRLQKVFEDFKALCDKKKEVFDGDIEALIEGRLEGRQQYHPWTMISVHTSGGTAMPMGAVCLARADGTRVSEAAMGDGPLDAVYNAINRITGIAAQLRDYQLHALSSGTDSQGEARVEIEFNAQRYLGRASSTDIIEASARAFLHAVNRIVIERTQTPGGASQVSG